MSRYTYSYRLGEKICNRIYSDSTLSKFISEIYVEDSVAFRNEWNSIKKKKDKIYISYDSTNKSCQAGEIAFAALIIRNRMYTKLKDAEEEMAERPNYMNVPDSIRELEKIEMIRQADGVYRLDYAVTATQKTILNALGIDANYIKKKVKEISDNLNPRVHKVKI